MPPRAPETAGRLAVDDRAGRASLVSAPHRPASSGLRDREHGDQRGDRASGREREGTGRARPKGRRCRSGDRADHARRHGGAAAERPRGGRTIDGPEPRAAHFAWRRSSDARPTRPSRPEDELRCEAHGGGRRRQHRRALGPAHGDGRGDSRGRRKGVRRQVGSDRSGDPFMRRAQAHKIRATRDERSAGPRSLLIVHAAELITLQGPAGPRRREMAEDLGLVEDGAVYAEGERIVEVGPTADVLGRHPQASVKIDATGQTVLPGFVDAHTHAVFAGSREHEVEWKAQGMGYREIAARGGDMIDAVASSQLASFCDVFVDDGFFTVDQGRRILTRAKTAGLGGKVHADELADTGGAVLAAEIGAASADHLLHVSSDGIDALARASVVGVLLPATSLVSHLPFADGRRLIAAGVPVALGTDFNPNTWCESPQLAIALACHHNGLLPAQAVVAATINAAHAVGLGTEVGSLEPGKLADILVLGVPSYRHLGYRIGGNAVRVVVKRGAVQVGGPTQ